MAKVYVKTNEQNIIIEINSEIFLDNTEGYMMVDEGYGDKYAHAQNNYLPKSLMDEKGRYNYKFVDGSVLELTDDEKSSLFPVPVPTPNELDILKEQQERTDQAVQDLILMVAGG